MSVGTEERVVAAAPRPARTAAALAREERALAAPIAWLLIGGVALSAAIVAAGLLVLLITDQTGYHNVFSPSLVTRPDTADFPTAPGGILRGALEGRAFALIELGLLVLIATPVLRVAASVLVFLHAGDRLYATVTTLVLALLLVSIFWIR